MGGWVSGSQRSGRLATTSWLSDMRGRRPMSKWPMCLGIKSMLGTQRTELACPRRCLPSRGGTRLLLFLCSRSRWSIALLRGLCQIRRETQGLEEKAADDPSTAEGLGTCHWWLRCKTLLATMCHDHSIYMNTFPFNTLCRFSFECKFHFHDWSIKNE